MIHGLGANPTPAADAQAALKFRTWRRHAGPPRITPGTPIDLRGWAPGPFDQGVSSGCGGFSTAVVGATAFNLILDYKVQFDPWYPYMLGAHGRDDGVSIWEVGHALESRGLLPVPWGSFPPPDRLAVPRLLDERNWGESAAIEAEGYTLRDATFAGTQAGNSPADIWELGNAALDYGYPFVLGIVITEAFETIDSGIPGIGGLSLGGHALAVLGRRPAALDGPDYGQGDPRQWIVRNSWGSAWGLHGDCYLARRHVAESPWAEMVAFISVDYPGEPPYPAASLRG